VKAGEFFRVHDGPKSWAFGRCRQHDDEWLVVEHYGKRRGEPRFDWPEKAWAPIARVVSYPYSLARANAESFLSYAEIWP
jgi:hypothetical protein